MPPKALIAVVAAFSTSHIALAEPVFFGDSEIKSCIRGFMDGSIGMNPAIPAKFCTCIAKHINAGLTPSEAEAARAGKIDKAMALQREGVDACPSFAVGENGAPPARDLKVPSCSTRFESDRPGARVIINGEYVGQTPTTVDMTELVQGGRDCLNNGSIITVKALPYQGGCVQLELIGRGVRLPRRMFFDTRLCAPRPSVDINIPD